MPHFTNSLYYPGCSGIKFTSIFGHLGVSMSDTVTIGIDRPEEEILTYEVSDEALERAAGDESERAGKYSIAWCTFLTGCPI